MKKELIAAIVAVTAIANGAPLFYWDFENWTGKNGTTSVASDGKCKMDGGTAAEDGFRGKGIRIDTKGAQARITDAKDWKVFTIEMKFKLDKGIDPKYGNALVCYAKNSWNRAQFLLWINKDRQVEARFTQVVRKEEFVVRSEPLTWETNRFYTIRVASQDEGALKIYLDGKLIAVRESGSWGFNRLQTKIPNGYPLLTPGRDMANISKIFRPLNGVIDDIKVWNTFEEPDALSEATTAGAGEGPLFVSGPNPAKTEKFQVLDRPGKALGSWIRPEKKYLDAAAHAEVKLTETDLVVKVVSPIAEGTSLDRRADRTWAGDVVEFFFRPNSRSDGYFQYGANASGWTAALYYPKNGTNDPDFKSKSRIHVQDYTDRWEAVFTIPRSELKLDGAPDGVVTFANFTRSGKTGGGQSTWSPVGSNFHSISRFRPVIFGSPRAALRKQLAVSREKFNGIGEGDPGLRKTVAADLDKLAHAIESDGDSVNNYMRLSRAVEQLESRYLQLKFSGIANLIWQSSMPWGNDIQLSPLASPVKKISLTLPQNSYIYTSLIFSNLTDRPFLGQLKCFSPERLKKKQVYQHFNRKISTKIGDGWGYADSGIYPNIKIYEALPIQCSGVILDPLIPLPLGTVVRAGSHESRQLWLKFSSRGMKPGKQHFHLILKPSYKGFQTQEIEVEADIRPVDLGGIELDSAHYSDVYRHGAHPDLVKFLVDKEINMIYSGGVPGQITMDIYPQVDQEGNIVRFSDYAPIDKFIDRTIAAGMKRERIKLWLWLELGMYGLHYRGKEQLKFNSPAWNKAFRSFLYHFTGHLEKKYGITKDRIFFYTTDEPDGDIDKPGTRMYNAYLYAEIIKNAGKDFRTMVNPRMKGSQGKYIDSLKKLSEVYDIFEFYRPFLNGELLESAKKLKKTVWTYGIYGKTVPPDVYRREYWQSFRDGFSSVVCYWHFDNHAGGDGLNSEDGTGHRVDYGSVYLDTDMGTILTGKREEAHLLGREDYKLAEFCRRRLEKLNDPALRKEFERIIEEGASANMNGMEQCRLKMLDLAEKLSRKQSEK